MEELFIGKVLIVVENIKKEIIHEIQCIKIDSEDFKTYEVESYKDNIDMYLECINGIYQDLIMGVLNKESRIKVFYNPMGSIEYKKIGDEENE